VYVLYEDADVIGTAFYIMEFLDGRFITDPLMPRVEPGERREMYVFCLSLLQVVVLFMVDGADG
jgi:aminoglycoside phosphotransferase (APT) family kinase protein